VPRVDFHGHLVPAPGDPPAGDDLVGFRASLIDLRAFMARHAIDRAVLSLPPVGLSGPGARDAAARRANEVFSAVARDAPDQFAALAAVPLPDAGAALEEIAYALDDLDMDGVALFTNYDGLYLDDARLAPVFAELDRRGAYVFLHPTTPPHAPASDYPAWVVEYPTETARCLLRLIYGGVLERHANLRLQVAHLGGVVPFIAHRIASLRRREARFAERDSGDPLDLLRRLWFDTGLSNHSPGLAATLQVTSIDRIVFGTDWPYAAPPEGDDPAPGLAWLGDQRAIVESGATADLVPRWST
jgi:6-methylsalicylate decarboxylase